MDIFEEGLKLVVDRHVDRIVRRGRVENEQKSRAVHITLRRLDCRKEILIRAKTMKENEKFKRIFISPNLTRKQQDADRELKRQLKEFREKGEAGAKVKSGKVVKKLAQWASGGDLPAATMLKDQTHKHGMENL